MAAKRAERLQVMLTIDEARQVEAWRLEHDVPSRSAAARKLLTLGLTGVEPEAGVAENRVEPLEGTAPFGAAGTAGTGSSFAGGAVGGRPAVLVIAGDFLVGQGIGRLLERSGYRVVGPVCAPEQAQTIAAGTNLAAAVLDACPTGETEAEAIRGVADALAHRDIPFVFIADGEREILSARHRTALMVSRASVGGRLARVLAQLIA